MSSWFTELAGKAENILNKIDKNAASVLKNESNERDQLLEIRSSNDIINGVHSIQNHSPIIRQTIPVNSLKLSKSAKILISPNRKAQFDIDEYEKNDGKFLGVTNGEDTITSFSNTSNSSRRSSWSSKTEGVQTVIELPLEKTAVEMVNGNESSMHTSTSSLSLSNANEEKTELMASKIVLAQVKNERDQLKSDILELKKQLAVAQDKNVIANLSTICDQLTNEKEQLQGKLNEIETTNDGYLKTISDLELAAAKSRENGMDLNERLAWAKSESEQAIYELQQYRARAQNTLQMKDDMIAELKALHLKNDSSTDELDIDSAYKQIESAKIKEERDSLLEELNTLRSQLNANKHIINTLEAKYHDTESRFSDNEKSLTNALKQEKIKYNQLEETLRTQAKELKAVRDEIKRHQISTATKIHEKYEFHFLVVVVVFLNWFNINSFHFHLQRQ